MNDWQVKIEEIHHKLRVNLWFYRHLSDGRTEVLTKDDIIKTIPEGEDIDVEPLVSMPIKLWDEYFLPSLQEYINPSQNKNFTEGKLEATEKHLEDMRDLVFKNND